MLGRLNHVDFYWIARTKFLRPGLISLCTKLGNSVQRTNFPRELCPPDQIPWRTKFTVTLTQSLAISCFGSFLMIIVGQTAVCWYRCSLLYSPQHAVVHQDTRWDHHWGYLTESLLLLLDWWWLSWWGVFTAAVPIVCTCMLMKSSVTLYTLNKCNCTSCAISRFL